MLKSFIKNTSGNFGVVGSIVLLTVMGGAG
jgi:hypothetical protein